jgi:hypothetical protein
MSPSSWHDPDDEFADVIERLRAEKAQADPLDLDRIKTTAMSRASRQGTQARRASMRKTLVVAMVTGSLMIGGTGAVLAGGEKNKGDDNDAAKGQYPCPPGTHGKSCKPCPNNHQGKSHKNDNRDCSPGPKPPPGSHQSNNSSSHQSH